MDRGTGAAMTGAAWWTAESPVAWSHWLAGVPIACAAGYLQGMTGLGFALVFTPLFVLVAPYPRDVVFLSLLIGTVLSAAVLVDGRRGLRARLAYPLLIGALVGTPAGVALLAFVPADTLTIVIAVTAIAVAAAWLIRLPPPVTHETPAVVTAGLLGGLLNGSTSMGGPPPALLASMQRWPVPTSRAALSTFNLASYAVAIATGLGTGVADADFLFTGSILLPAAVVGSILGGWSARRVSTGAFRYVLIGVVWLAGLTSLGSVLLGT